MTKYIYNVYTSKSGMRLKTNFQPNKNLETSFKVKYKAPHSEILNKFIKDKSVKKLSTAKAWSSSLNAFACFLWTVYEKTIEEMISELQADEEKNNKSNKVYELLQNFVIWQIEQNEELDEDKQLIADNIIMKTKRAKIFLTVNDITISDDKFKHKVNMPSKEGTADKEPLDYYTVKKILDATRDPGLYVYLLFLAVTGCRAKEALSLRLCDIHFESDPPSIFIRKKYTKTRMNDKTVMITDELAQELRQWLATKYAPRRVQDTYENCGIKAPTHNNKVFTDFKRIVIPKQNPEDLVFAPLHLSGYTATIKSLYNNNRAKFIDILKLIKLDKFEYGGKRHVYTLHSYRRFVRSQLSNDRDFAEYHIGHIGSTYWRKTWAQKRATFLSFAPLITFNDAKMLEEKQLEASNQYIQTQERLSEVEELIKKTRFEPLDKQEKGLIDDENGMNQAPTIDFVMPDGTTHQMLDRRKARWQKQDKKQEIQEYQKEPKIELKPKSDQASPNLLSDLADMLKDPEKSKILTRIIEELKK